MSRQQQSGGAQFPSDEQGLAFLMYGIQAWSISIEVFIRHSMGVRYPGGKGALVFLLVPIYCLFWEGYDIVPMMWFLAAYLVMCARHRAVALKQRFQGTYGQSHSFYTGVSYLQQLNPKLHELLLKTWLEPAFVAFAGLMVAAYWNDPLGVYLLIGAGCRWMTSLLSSLRDETRVLDLNDQVVEQQMVAERFRRGQGRRF